MQNYKCKTCGAELFWNATTESLKCEYCDSVFSVLDYEDHTLKEHHQTEEIDLKYTNAGEDLDNNMMVLNCTNCDAEIVTSKTTMATECVYCGHALSVSHNVSGKFRPEKIIPFKIDKKTAKEKYFKYAKSSILIPKEFKDITKIDKMQGIYVPYYLHSLNISVESALDCKTEECKKNGDDMIVITKSYDVNIDANGEFNDIPVNASKQMDTVTMEAIEPFDFNNIEDFNPAYMAGYFAEQPDKTTDYTSSIARQRAEAAMKEKIKETADTIDKYESKTFKEVKSEYKNEERKYAMMPVWLCNIMYKNKKYTFLINGDSGKIIGELPFSKLKFAGILGSAFIIMQILLTFILN